LAEQEAKELADKMAQERKAESSEMVVDLLLKEMAEGFYLLIFSAAKTKTR
jgi:hypothetical protein